MPDAQDVDSLFPAKSNGPQDVDSLFPQSVEAERHAANYGERSGSTVQDLIFGDATRNPVARLLDAFGEGFKQGWGSDNLGLSELSQKALRDAGLFNDYQKGQHSIVKAGNEVLIRPAATALDAIWRVGAGAFRGGQATVAQAGEEAGYPLLGREIAALPEAFPVGTAHVIGEAPSLLDTARSLRIIGKGEAGWKGTAPVEETTAAPAKIELPPEEKETENVLAASAAATPAPPPAAPVPSVHQVVRESNPDLFAKYDPLIEQQVQLRMFIDEGIDTEAARSKLAGVDKEIAELAPQVQQAYRDAAEKTNAITIPPPGQFNSMAEMLAARGQEAPARSIEDQRAFIANDVARQLIAAGRPADEAQAAGAVTAARYVTRAARMNGALGTAQKLYEREGAEIRGTKPPAGSAPAQGPAQPPPSPQGIDATHDVVSGANSAKNPNGPVYIDKRIPELSPVLKDSQGNPVNLHNLLQLHERVEADEMAKGVPYDKAHIAATAAEREVAQQTGIDFDAYTKEIDGYLSHIENEKAENPPTEPLHVDTNAAIGHHKSTNKAGGMPFQGMIQNAEKYRAAAKKRREAGGSTVRVFKNDAERLRYYGKTQKEVTAELADAQKRFDEALTQADLKPDEIPAQDRDIAIERMINGRMGPLEALDYATAKVEHEARQHESEEARYVAERIIEAEEGRDDLLGEIPFDTGEHHAGAGEAGEGQAAGRPAKAGEPARQTGEARTEDELEYFQRKRAARNLIAEREAEGQLQLPGADRISQAVLVQRRANEPLKPNVAQEPMDIGLFSDEAKQRELFQMRAPRAHGKDYYQIKAFHGSPYDFDKFDLSKIGTGEGAQAYGHGLYFAENPAVAGDYKSKLSTLANVNDSAEANTALTYLARNNYDKAAARADLERSLGTALPDTHRVVEAINSYNPGRMYEVNIAADPEHFLDWDKPLSEQSPQVQKALASTEQLHHAQRAGLNNPTGADLINKVIGDSPQSSQVLRQAGIPGIKYLDQGSRQLAPRFTVFDRYGQAVSRGLFDEEQAARIAQENGGRYESTQPQPTHNYVVFDDNLIKITHKDGKPVEGSEREAVIKELYQRQQDQRDLAQGPQGKVRIAPDRKPIITLARTADASTFIHESGHVYLEELMRDAEHPQAPDLLKADAHTVKEWLGVDSAENIKTRHHEKFARAFEQYLREGVAPSASLARVFAQFRDWLLHIYQTIRGLGEPINDDIRGVFDRLLAEKPERTVIAPELAKRPTLADIHEADANLAEPATAEAMGDRVTAEDTRYGAALPGDIADEHTRGAAEIGAGGTERGALSETGGAAEPVAPSGVGGPQPGAEQPSGGEVVPEGAGARTEQKPVGPNDPLPRSEGHFIDKAGNIRLDNLGTPEDVNAVIHMTVADSGEFMPERRGVVSDQQVLDLAEALGMTPEQLNTRRIGQAYNAEQISAARKLLIQSAQNVRDLAVKAAEGTDADVLAYAVAADRHRMIQGQVSGITAEAGRALRAFRSLAGADTERAVSASVMEATGKTLFQQRAAARKIANLSTAEQVSKLIRDSERKGFFDWLQAWFVNALISGPLTHAGYTTAGEIYGLFRAVGETGAAALVGKVREITGFGEAEYAKAAEVPHQLYGMMMGARHGVKNAWAAIKSNQVVLPPEVERQLQLGDVTGQTVSTREVIPNPTVAGYKIPIGTAIEAPGRFVAALHSFNWTTFYSQSIAGQAFRQATHERLQGEAFADRVANLIANPTNEMVEEAGKDANAGALMQRPDYDSAMGYVSRLTNLGVRIPDIPLPGGRSIPMGTLRPLKYIDPFVQIQANIQRTAFMRGTPLALFSQAVRDDLSMKNGGVAFDRTAGRIIAGTGFMLAAGGLAAEGLLNHSGPTDPKESREWQRIYGLPHGLRIGEMSYDVLRLGNLGLQMSVAADLYHAVHQIQSEDASKVSAELVHAFAQNIIDESSMRGPAEILQAIDDSDRYGEAWVRNFVSSFVPFSVGMSQVARQIDPYSRVARTTMDAIKAKIPFETETLMPRRDVWGEPVPNRGWLGTYRQAIVNDPVDQALYALHVYPALPERRIRGVLLTDQQYDDFSRIAGRDAHMRLNALVTMPGFNVMPTESKLTLIKNAIEGSRERARNVVMIKSAARNDNQFPDILVQAEKNKTAKLHPTLH